ncbi:hypothetical protein WISP_134346 [Willisornis vidua]|uniref:Uncharacterized protein n=1 Tax=Willisornis vidua TaxID=1566151 RepID=A0ABQ9CUJ0_9PASS|nr:hypothetical protein WISP_134346 [Willisornis vidua]
MSSPSIPGKMEAKPLFNVQKALVQPVQMCMLDIPLSVQDDDVPWGIVLRVWGFSFITVPSPALLLPILETKHKLETATK